ncbi:protein kinase [Nitrosomonas sp. Nm166]|uniref:protein kinase domain-containing protein n=1 Tax=Nitrosomonas sp. Nm166 TaxID=1881054 RepID=UPI0008E6665A|nr:protein kinase [Nitrosomonas sp. Nm166]SFE34908.1 Serine/threonine protein kinase [Nitrosomonas sp. Nm166]
MTHVHDKILPAGTQIGVYEIKDAVKMGTFDIVYRAWNHHLKEGVKIQEYFPRDFAMRANDGLGVEPKSIADKENFEYGLKAFLHQAEVLTQIEHPHLAVAENVLQFNGTAYLMMRIRKGISLSRLMQSTETLAETELKFILVSILSALQKIHEHKIVHGGIQPAAIVLNQEGEPLLIDFAAARLAIAARAALLADELAAGYAPVEQYESAEKAGPATDFYALGATMYYCITHQQPVVAQSRRMILSAGEPDPMALPAESGSTRYSAELLKAINWMLQPEYDHRPQSASEILTLLEPQHASKQAKLLTSRQAATDTAKRNKNPLWIGATAGIVALVAAALWFNEKKPAEISDDPSGTVIAQPSLQPSSAKSAVTVEPETEADQSVAGAVTESDKASSSERISVVDQETMSEAEKQSAERESTPTNSLVTEPESGSEQVAMLDQSAKLDESTQSRQSNFSQQPTDTDLIKKHLAAAGKALKAGRFTTPLKDNAYTYYQMVLRLDPDNAEALAGLQKIVDRYIQFIGKARAEGRFYDAKLYLKRAESVLPGDPKLQGIRAELAVVK